MFDALLLVLVLVLVLVSVLLLLLAGTREIHGLVEKK